MPLVLARVFQEVAVELLDVVLGEVDRFPVGEDAFHGIGIACDLLLVTGREGLDLDVGEELLDFMVGEFRALDSRG